MIIHPVFTDKKREKDKEIGKNEKKEMMNKNGRGKEKEKEIIYFGNKTQHYNLNLQKMKRHQVGRLWWLLKQNS